MINKELFYKVTLIDCNGKELEVAKFLQILTGMEKTETRRIRKRKYTVYDCGWR